MRGAIPLAVVEEMNRAKRSARIHNCLMMGCLLIALFGESLVEALF